MKQKLSEDWRHYHFDHCSQVDKKIPEGQEKNVKKVTGNATWKMYQRDLIFIVIRIIFGT